MGNNCRPTIFFFMVSTENCEIIICIEASFTKMKPFKMSNCHSVKMIIVLCRLMLSKNKNKAMSISALM